MPSRASGRGRVWAALIVAAIMAAIPVRAETPARCEAGMQTMMAYIRETDGMDGPARVMLDRVVSGIATPVQRREGCRLFRRLLPRYLRIQRFAGTCLADRPDIQAEGLIRGNDRGIERARTYLAVAHCRR